MGAQKKMQNVQRFASAAERENGKLRVENERLSTIIDSGDWNKDRVGELVRASQVLSGERVALTKLIGRLQRQHQLALEQQEQQEIEIRNLKEQLLSEVDCSGQKELDNDVVKKISFASDITPSLSTDQNVDVSAE